MSIPMPSNYVGRLRNIREHAGMLSGKPAPYIKFVATPPNDNQTQVFI